MESWRKSFERVIGDVMWAQWAALGAYLAAEPCRKAVIDPEALLVATCAFGRGDARIFDEALDWTVVNHRLLKPWRLKKIGGLFGADTLRALGALLDYAALETGRDLFPGVREEARRALEEAEEEELFYREKGLYGDGTKARDELFARWKLLRGAPRVRRHSGKPDLDNPANLMLRLRRHYGAGARADVMTYLLTNEGGSSNGIAARIKYRQGSVYGVLEDLVRAGIVQKKGGRGNARYWIDRERVAASLGLGKRLPAFFAWGDVFRAFFMVASDSERFPGKYADAFLAAERRRDLALEVVPMLREAGEPLAHLSFPGPERLRGEEYPGALAAFLEEAAGILRRHTLD